MPRLFPAFCAWSDQEIVILGGYDEEDECLGDGWVLDTRSDTLRQVICPTTNTLHHYSVGNQS